MTGRDEDQRIFDKLVEMFNATSANFLVEDTEPSVGESSRICAVYFSSLAVIPQPRTAETFCREIVGKNRYEWYGTRLRRASRHVFVRDLSMLWYQHGIGADADSIEKTAELLRRITAGYDIVCIGSSAGGYAAVCFAHLLGAKYAIAFSPMFDVRRYIQSCRQASANSECWHAKYDDLLASNDKYMSLTGLLQANDVRIYAYFPIFSQLDIPELADASQTHGVRCCLHEDGVHGFGFSRVVAEKFINLERPDLDRLFCNRQMTSRELADFFGNAMIEFQWRRRKKFDRLRKYKVQGYFGYLCMSALFKSVRFLRTYLMKRGLYA